MSGLRPPALEDRAGRLWIGTDDGGLNRLDPTDESLVRYRHGPDDPRSPAHDTVFGLWEEHEGTLWIATRSIAERLVAACDAFARQIYEIG